jgi:flagellar motor component MotA
MAEDTPRPATHVLSTAGTMLGVTATLVGLIKLLESQTHPRQVDELAGAVVVLFLLAAIASYASIRLEYRAEKLSRRSERIADVAFVLGLLSLAGLTILFAWQVL